MSEPLITFGIIVLNGEPFTRYCIRALYPFAHQIIIVEGASPLAASIATPDGHSTDDTLGVLMEMKRDEDPDDKITVITAEDAGYPDGFWPGEKDEQSQAYADRCTGDWLWQVDIDEFYSPQAMKSVLQKICDDSSFTGASFRTVTFFGDIDIVTDSCFLRGEAGEYRRLFQWKPGFKYITHRPPTVVDSDGTDLTSINWLSAEQMSHLGVELLHYSLVFPKQINEKAAYYSAAQHYAYDPAAWAKYAYGTLNWPFRYHNVYIFPSWLERYRGQVPGPVLEMRERARVASALVGLRQNHDIEELLSGKSYVLKRLMLKMSCLPSRYGRVGSAISRMIQRLIVHPVTA